MFCIICALGLFFTHTSSFLISMDKGSDDYRDYKIFIQNPSRGLLSIFVAIYLLKTEMDK